MAFQFTRPTTGKTIPSGSSFECNTNATRGDADAYRIGSTLSLTFRGQVKQNGPRLETLKRQPLCCLSLSASQ